MTTEQAEELSLLVKQHFGLGEEPLATFPADLEQSSNQLARLIAYLLEKDFQRLVQGMYRIDVSERGFKEALALPAFSDVVARLTELVLNREMMKVQTRLWYRQKSKNPIKG